MNRALAFEASTNLSTSARFVTVRGLRSAVLVLTVAMILLSACGSDRADPVQGDPGDMTEVTHMLEPTDQMRQAAEQQCLDNPDQKVGYVRAVSPETGEQLAELEVDCVELRSQG